MVPWVMKFSRSQGFATSRLYERAMGTLYHTYNESDEQLLDE